MKPTQFFFISEKPIDRMSKMKYIFEHFRVRISNVCFLNPE